MDSIDYYNSLATDYEGVYKQRFRYHEAIDNCIRSNKNFSRWENVLDIGSGKGKRLTELFSGHSARLSCVENSREMAKDLKKNTRISMVFEEDFCLMSNESFNAPFDVVLLQWNVLGHLLDVASAFEIISTISRTGSYLIFDLNNPFNVNQYGLKNVTRNFLSFARNGQKNELSFQIMHNDSSTETKFFRLKYITKLLQSNGFRVEKLNYFDYNSGKPTNFLRGQTFIEAVKI